MTGSVLMPLAHVTARGPSEAPGSGSQPMTMIVSKGCAITRARLIRVAWAAMWDHSIIQTKVMVKGHAWVCGTAEARVYVDVCGS